MASVTPLGSSGAPPEKMVVHNGLLFLIMMCNNFANKQMDSGAAESETIKLLTNVEMKLSNDMMQSLEEIQGYINNIILSGGYCADPTTGNPILIPSDNTAYNGNNSHGTTTSWTYTPKNPTDPLYNSNGSQKNYTVWSMTSQQTQDEMQNLNAEYSTVQQQGTINTDTIQGFVQAFQTALQMLMSAMQSMTSMYDSISSKEAYDASLVAG